MWFEISAGRRDIKPVHTALFFWIVELSNRLGWPEVMGLPSDRAMSVLNIGSYKTYSKALSKIAEIGMVLIVEKSKNQYTSTQISLSQTEEKKTTASVKNTEANTEAPRFASVKNTEAVPEQMPEHPDLPRYFLPEQMQYNKTSKNYNKTSKNCLNENSAADDELKFSKLLNFVIFSKSLKLDENWKTGIEMNYGNHGIRSSDVPRLLDEFGLVQLTRRHPGWQTERDFTKHFQNWLRVKIASNAYSQSNLDKSKKQTGNIGRLGPLAKLAKLENTD